MDLYWRETSFNNVKKVIIFRAGRNKSWTRNHNVPLALGPSPWAKAHETHLHYFDFGFIWSSVTVSFLSHKRFHATVYPSMVRVLWCSPAKIPESFRTLRYFTEELIKSCRQARKWSEVKQETALLGHPSWTGISILFPYSPDNRFVRLYQPYGLVPNYSTLSMQHESSQRQSTSKCGCIPGQLGF